MPDLGLYMAGFVIQYPEATKKAKEIPYKISEAFGNTWANTHRPAAGDRRHEVVKGDWLVAFDDYMFKRNAGVDLNKYPDRWIGIWKRKGNTIGYYADIGEPNLWTAWKDGNGDPGALWGDININGKISRTVTRIIDGYFRANPNTVSDQDRCRKHTSGSLHQFIYVADIGSLDFAGMLGQRNYIMVRHTGADVKTAMANRNYPNNNYDNYYFAEDYYYVEGWGLAFYGHVAVPMNDVTARGIVLEGWPYNTLVNITEPQEIKYECDANLPIGVNGIYFGTKVGAGSATVRLVDYMPLGKHQWNFSDGSKYISFGWSHRYLIPTMQLFWQNLDGSGEYTHIFNDEIRGLGDAGSWKIDKAGVVYDAFDYSPPKIMAPPEITLPYQSNYNGQMKYRDGKPSTGINISYSWQRVQTEVNTPIGSFNDVIMLNETWSGFAWQLMLAKNIGIIYYAIIFNNGNKIEGWLNNYYVPGKYDPYSLSDNASLNWIKAPSGVINKGNPIDFIIRLTNNGTKPWDAGRDIEERYKLGIKINGNYFSQIDLPQAVYPGETIEISSSINYSTIGKHTLSFAMLQERVHWI